MWDVLSVLFMYVLVTTEKYFYDSLCVRIVVSEAK